jgi:hypothetical protein
MRRRGSHRKLRDAESGQRGGGDARKRHRSGGAEKVATVHGVSFNAGGAGGYFS